MGGEKIEWPMTKEQLANKVADIVAEIQSMPNGDQIVISNVITHLEEVIKEAKAYKSNNRDDFPETKR